MKFNLRISLVLKATKSLALILFATVALAQQRPPQFDMEIKSTKLTDMIYLLEGAGGNVAVFIWDDGVLLIDDKLSPATPAMKIAIAAITPKPIRFVVNSHWHRDHSGGNQELANDGSVIVAHENVRKRMSVEGFIAVFDRKMPPSPPKALPVVTFTRNVTFHLGGEEISIIHVDPAHTDGDSFVLFRNAKILHMGDCYLNGSYPVIDYVNGGTFTGIITAADRALNLLDSGSRIIPGHGPVATQSELREWRDMVASIHDRVKKSVAAGRTLEQIKAEQPTKEWDARMTRSFVTSAHPIEEAYRTITMRPKK